MEQNLLTFAFKYVIISLRQVVLKFSGMEWWYMNIYNLLPKLIASAMEHDKKTLESIAIMMSRELKKEYPEISSAIISSLSSDSFRTERSLNMKPAPIDKESRFELINIKRPLDVLPPVLDDKTNKQLFDLIKERSLIKELLENDITPPNSILLYGVPGVGKTYIANWLASELNLPLLILNLASSISSYLGRTGQNIHSIFEYAKSQNAILFLDELDAIAKRRDDAGDLGELKRLVNVLLKELDECPYSCIIIGATNHPDLLDKAIWRRFDRTIEVPLPTEIERIELVKRHLSKFYELISKDVVNYLCKNTNEVNAADMCKLCEHIKRRTILEKKSDVDILTLEELFILKPLNGKDKKKEICLNLKSKFPNLTQRDIAKITQIPLSSVSRYLIDKRKDDK